LSWRLLGVIQKQAAEIQDLRDEIQRLKKSHRSTDHQTESIALAPIPDEETKMAPRKNVRASEKDERKPDAPALMLTRINSARQNCHRTPIRRLS